MNQSFKNVLYILVGISLLIATTTIWYYYLITLPGIEKDKLDYLKKQDEQEMLEQKQQSDDFSTCMSIAQNEYDIKKDDYCKNSFNNMKRQYENCIISKQKESPSHPIGSKRSSVDWIRRNPDGTPLPTQYTLTQATELCKASYNRPDNSVYNPNCINISLDKSLEIEKDRCTQLYK